MRIKNALDGVSEGKAARNAAIARERRLGQTADALAQAFGLSRVRIEEIAAREERRAAKRGDLKRG